MENIPNYQLYIFPWLLRPNHIFYTPNIIPTYEVFTLYLSMKLTLDHYRSHRSVPNRGGVIASRGEKSCFTTLLCIFSSIQ